MDPRGARAAQIQQDIGRVLLEEWDPIEVVDEPLARAEYDSYVGGVYRLLASGASAEQIAQHLLRIEMDRLDLHSVPERRLPTLLRVAESLLRLDVGLKPESRAT